MMGSFNAEFRTDGSGDWKIWLPTDADQHDVLALGPVIQGVRAFLAPTVTEVPIGHALADGDLPDLIA